MYFSQLLLFTIYLFPNVAQDTEVRRIEAPDIIERTEEGFEKMMSSCDLTENKCDNNCCFDKDCTKWEKSSFNCAENDYEVTENFADLSEHECDSGEGGPVMCIQHSNSPYLGKFYQDQEEENVDTRTKQGWAFFPQQPEILNKNIEPIHFYPAVKLRNRVPSNILGKSGYCVLRPIKMPFNTHSKCTYTISEDTCLSNQLFNINSFVSDEMLSFGGDSGNITLQHEIICLHNGSEYVTMSKNMFHENYSSHFNREELCGLKNYTKLNKNKQTCDNIIVGLKYHLNFNSSMISGGKLTVLIANIPTTVDSLAKSKNQTFTSDRNNLPFLYVSQSVSVFFNDTNNQKPLSKHITDGYRIKKGLEYF